MHCFMAMGSFVFIRAVRLGHCLNAIREREKQRALVHEKERSTRKKANEKDE